MIGWIDEDPLMTTEETEMTEITKELVEVLQHIRRVIDDGNGNLVYFGDATKVRIDAILERYEESCRNPEPVINRVEIITHDEGRVYVNWEKDNKITTSLQDEGRTLKVFVNTNTNTEEPDIIEINGVKYQRVEEPKPRTLNSNLLTKTQVPRRGCEKICKIVEEWISQYSCDWVVCNEYLDGYTDALNHLKENLK